MTASHHRQVVTASDGYCYPGNSDHQLLFSGKEVLGFSFLKLQWFGATNLFDIVAIRVPFNMIELLAHLLQHAISSVLVLTMRSSAFGHSLY